MPSASVTAPTRIFSHSASVLGRVSTTPFLPTTVPTESNTKSEAGSIMSRISSLTETTGLRSPQSSGARDDAGAGAAFDEHALVHTHSKTPTDEFLRNFTDAKPRRSLSNGVAEPQRRCDSVAHRGAV